MRIELGPNSYLFPGFKKKGKKLDDSNHVHKDYFKVILESLGTENGYTLHCFRRGGGQHRFLFAAKQWNLRSCKWWGGWAPGEGSNTLMKVCIY
jgi:hypothetical protein